MLVGPSGCGKTTALRMLAGLEEVSEGRILIGDRVVNNVAPGARNVAMVFQSYALYPHMTVYDNLAFSLRNRKLPKAEIDRRVADAARILELDELLKRKPKQLSGGQRQRVALGRAIVREPDAVPDGRAAVEPRRRAARADAGRDPQAAAAARHDDDLRHPRPGRGDDDGRPDRGHEQGRAAADRDARGALHASRPTPSWRRFIGSPAMNLLPPELLGIGGPKGSSRASAPSTSTSATGAPRRRTYEATVEVVEYLGDEQLAHLRLGDTPLLAKLPVDPRLPAESTQTFSVAAAAGAAVRCRERAGSWGPPHRLPAVALTVLDGSTFCVCDERGDVDGTPSRRASSPPTRASCRAAC